MYKTVIILIHIRIFNFVRFSFELSSVAVTFNAHIDNKCTAFISQIIDNILRSKSVAFNYSITNALHILRRLSITNRASIKSGIINC